MNKNQFLSVVDPVVRMMISEIVKTRKSPATSEYAFAVSVDDLPNDHITMLGDIIRMTMDSGRLATVGRIVFGKIRSHAYTWQEICNDNGFFNGSPFKFDPETMATARPVLPLETEGAIPMFGADPKPESLIYVVRFDAAL